MWLQSAGKVAAALGVDRLTGRPVALPVEALLGGIGRVRAHFYASFHSGRQDETSTARPISRTTLRQITHVPQRTQRLYERTAGIGVRSNIAVGERLTDQNIQERAWRHGRAVFAFNDRQGQQGPAGGRYVAWRLPNSYQGCHAQSPPGRQKKINRQIDLVNLGAQGNELPAEGNLSRSAIFHPDGQSAGQAYNRNSAADAYWPQNGTFANRHRLWHIIARAKIKNDMFSKTCHFSRCASRTAGT